MRIDYEQWVCDYPGCMVRTVISREDEENEDFQRWGHITFNTCWDSEGIVFCPNHIEHMNVVKRTLDLVGIDSEGWEI